VQRAYTYDCAQSSKKLLLCQIAPNNSITILYAVAIGSPQLQHTFKQLQIYPCLSFLTQYLCVGCMFTFVFSNLFVGSFLNYFVMDKNDKEMQLGSHQHKKETAQVNHNSI